MGGIGCHRCMDGEIILNDQNKTIFFVLYRALYFLKPRELSGRKELEALCFKNGEGRGWLETSVEAAMCSRPNSTFKKKIEFLDFRLDHCEFTS